MIGWLQDNSAAINVIAMIVLVSVTGYYAYLTRKILSATEKQSKLSLDPVVGIAVKDIGISEVFGPNRRNLSVDLELTNIGNAPAIEVLVDAELILRHSNIDGNKIIPCRHDPDVIPFIRPGEVNIESDPNFGNKAVTHFFDDVREFVRLNRHRIETDPTHEYYPASRLRIITYYRNSLDQQFKSYYETEINLRKGKDDPIPAETETADVHMIRLPRPIFHAGPISKDAVKKEIEVRNNHRNYSGW